METTASSITAIQARSRSKQAAKIWAENFSGSTFLAQFCSLTLAGTFQWFNSLEKYKWQLCEEILGARGNYLRQCDSVFFNTTKTFWYNSGAKIELWKFFGKVSSNWGVGCVVEQLIYKTWFFQSLL